MSKDLYGDKDLLPNELAKGYTRPIVHGTISKLPENIRKAHDELIAHRKLNLIICGKVGRKKPVIVRTLVRIYVKQQSQKLGTWSPAKPAFKFDPSFQTVTLQGVKGTCVKAGARDVRHASSNGNQLAVAIRDAIDEGDRSIRLKIDSCALRSASGEEGKFRSIQTGVLSQEAILKSRAMFVNRTKFNRQGQLRKLITANNEISTQSMLSSMFLLPVRLLRITPCSCATDDTYFTLHKLSCNQVHPSLAASSMIYYCTSYVLNLKSSCVTKQRDLLRM